MCMKPFGLKIQPTQGIRNSYCKCFNKPHPNLLYSRAHLTTKLQGPLLKIEQKNIFGNKV